jgi:type II restriction enzyme
LAKTGWHCFHLYIHSLNTNFGATIFEPIALELAKSNFNVIVKQVNAGTRISNGAQREIQNIIDENSAANIRPNKNDEIERIRKVCLSGKIHRVKLTIHREGV